MLREKYNSLTNKRGYLYIRETIYQRDKRTLKKKPSKLGDGSATKNRWKYSLKKDTYCGKIIENIEIKHIITFQEYLKKIKYGSEQDFDFLEYKIKTDFDKILDDFVNYLIYIHKINDEEFKTGKKKAYAINNGFLSRETIEWVRRFRINKSPENPREFERFMNRCLASGIFDEEIIETLYLKLIPDKDILKKDKLNEEDLSKNEIKKIKIRKLRSFIKESITKDD